MYLYFPFIRRLFWERVNLEVRPGFEFLSNAILEESFLLFPCLEVGDNNIYLIKRMGNID